MTTFKLKLRKAQIRKKTREERVGEFGEDVFATLVKTKIGWTAIESKDLDKAGIDREFRCDSASIDTQIRTSTLQKKNNSHFWSFRIFSQGKKLDKKLYRQPNFFLILVGLHCDKEEFEMTEDPFGIKRTILMVLGMKVVKQLQGKRGHNLTIYVDKLERKGYDWLKGTEKSLDIFASEYKRQTYKDMSPE